MARRLKDDDGRMKAISDFRFSVVPTARSSTTAASTRQWTGGLLSPVP